MTRVPTGRGPAWSPNGNKIAFASEPTAGTTEIFRMDANGSNQLWSQGERTGQADTPNARVIRRGATATLVLLAVAGGASAFGAFEPRVDYPAGDKSQFVAVSDFDRDGRRDLAVTNQNDDDVSILEGKSDGTFKPKVDYPVGDGPLGVAVGDFDRDQKQDLAVANTGDDDVSILLNEP